MVRDAIGNPLGEGDLVAFPIALGNIAPGHVAKINSVLAADPNAQPTINVSIMLTLPAAPNGVVPGVIKAVAPAGSNLT